MVSGSLAEGQDVCRVMVTVRIGKAKIAEVHL